MSNEYYSHTTFPSPNAPGSSAAMRAELTKIEAAFSKLPTIAGNAGKLVVVGPAGLTAGGELSAIDLSLNPSGVSSTQGRLMWSSNELTASIGMTATLSQNIGQDVGMICRNMSGSTITKGTVVSISGFDASSSRFLIAPATAPSGTVPAGYNIGIASDDIVNGGQGHVTTQGFVRGLNTSALTAGNVIWLSSTNPGQIATTTPTGTSATVIIGRVLVASGSNGVIYVEPRYSVSMEALSNVGLVSGLTNNDILVYSSSQSMWLNRPGPSGSIVGTTDTQTLSNKTIQNSSLTNVSVFGLPDPSTFTGPDASTGAATKGYVDTVVSGLLSASGGTVNGLLSMNGNRITNVGTPTLSTDAATKGYVDSIAQGLDTKASVRVATTANITLSGTQTIDGVAVVAGDRVLVKNQTTASQNGVYVVAAGAWARSTDMDLWAELPGAFVFVEEGTSNKGSGWVCTVVSGGVLGSTNITFEQFSGAGQIDAGAGLTKTGNQLNIGTASSARIVVNADNIDLATTGVTASTYRSVTVDAYGRVTAGSNPTTIFGYGITDAYTKTEMDTALGQRLTLSGGTMTGNIAMGNNKVTGLATPTANGDAVNLQYVTTLYGSTSSAATSASEAAASASSAAASASNASTSASSASTSASSASTSATAASTSATNAANSATAAANSFDSFDDRYLGAKTSNPALDNDGNALLVGALYFNSTLGEMRVYNGSSWVSPVMVGGTVSTLTVTGTLTLQGLTGNRVAFVDSGNVLTTSAGLLFDGSNMSVGQTLSAWNTSYRALQLGAQGAISARSDSTNIIDITTNSYNATDGKWKYLLTGPALRISIDGTSGRFQWFNSASGTAGTESLWSPLMTLDATGNIGVGVVPAAWSTLIRAFQIGQRGSISGWSGATNSLSISNNTYYASDATWKYLGASGAASRFDMNTGRFEWYTAASGLAGNTVSFVQAMTLDAAGNLMVGTTTQRGVGGITLTPNTSNGAGEIAFNRNSTTSTSFVLGFQNAGTTVGYISYTNSVVTYNTGSDARLKENVTPAPETGPIIDAINIIQHDWKSGGHADFSVIAQDLHQVYPQAVTPGDDGEQIERTWGVDYSKLVPLLVKEVQSLRARVAALEGV